ncbi:unnamed protein product, partial [Toxocara canis]|uniref:Helitron_like_N domain-containing protein n=1 Tax=Toxocara canis TaxID=6265 RepID=A0A183U471_TOXCA
MKEVSKRGLPHVHLLLCVESCDRVVSPEDIERVVQAFISSIPPDEDPDKLKKLRLRKLVLGHMIHRPCRNSTLPCQTGSGVCSKGFPKPFREHTSVDTSGYALLKRPNDGTMELLSDRRTVVTNRDVVPYNPYLLMRFRTHINVEHCASIEAIKYIYKYVFKGYDCAIMEVMRKKINRLTGADVNFDAALPAMIDDEGVERVHDTVADDDASNDHPAPPPDSTDLDAACDVDEYDSGENNAIGIQ